MIEKLDVEKLEYLRFFERRQQDAQNPKLTKEERHALQIKIMEDMANAMVERGDA